LKGLAALRIKRGLTQLELGERFGVDNNTISRYERCLLRPSLEMLQRLAAFFDVSVDELLNGPAKNEWKINIIWEVEDMQALDIKKDEFAVGFRDNGDIMLWGSIPSDKTLDEAAARIRDEISAAMAGRSAFNEAKKVSKEE